MIIRDVAERHLPSIIRPLEDRIARMRRAGFDDMRIRMLVAIAGAADAAGIDDQPAVAKPYGAGQMGVGAQDQGLRDSLGKLMRSSGERATVPSGCTVSSQ